MAELGKRKAGLQKKVTSIFKGVPIPPRSTVQQAAGVPARNDISGAHAESKSPLISLSPLMRRLSGTETPSEDKAPPSHTGGASSVLTEPDHPASQTPAPRQLSQTETPPDKAPPGRAGGVPPRLTTPDEPTTQSSLIRKLSQTEASSDEAAPGRTASVPPRPTSMTRPMSQGFPSERFHGPDIIPKEVTPAKRPDVVPLRESAGRRLCHQISNKLLAPKPGVSPTRQKAMVVLVPVLAIVMIFTFRQVLSTSPRRTQAATDDGTPVVATAKSGHEIDWQIPDPLPAMERDPTKLPEQVAATSNAEPNQAVAGSATETFNVRDIVYSKDKPSAVVNARIVYVGHKVGSATVVQILRDGVEFERDGKRWVEKIHD